MSTQRHRGDESPYSWSADTGEDSPGEVIDKTRLSDPDTPEVPHTRYDLQILQYLRRIMRAIDIHSRKLKSQHKITGPQLVCLLAVVDEGPITATRIAERVFLSASTVVGILDRLEEHGLVQRERDAQDRRLVNITATGGGLELARKAPSPLQDGLANGLKELPELEQATIALSLKRIGDLMEVRDIETAPLLDPGNLDDEVNNGGLSH
ncbi:MarR family transcriptional regulator [candidate division GN15 bacterium]|nr:MarR family transcriptional regulator [candidate division GN15 bacterium]